MDSNSNLGDEIKPEDSISQIMLGDDKVDNVSLSSSSVASNKRMHLRALAQKAQALAEQDGMDERKEIEAEEMLLKNKKEQVRLKIQIRKEDALVSLSSNSSSSHVSSKAQKWQERVEANQDKQQKSTADENSMLVSLVEQNLKL